MCHWPYWDNVAVAFRPHLLNVIETEWERSGGLRREKLRSVHTGTNNKKKNHSTTSDTVNLKTCFFCHLAKKFFTSTLQQRGRGGQTKGPIDCFGSVSSRTQGKMPLTAQLYRTLVDVLWIVVIVVTYKQTVPTKYSAVDLSLGKLLVEFVA